MHRTSILQLVLQKCEAKLTEMLFTKREEAKLNKGLFTFKLLALLLVMANFSTRKSFIPGRKNQNFFELQMTSKQKEK